PAAVAVLVNALLTMVLVDSIGAKGAFLASLIAMAFLVPPLARAGLASVGLSLREFTHHAMLPGLVVALLTAAAASLALGLPVANLATVIVGGTLGAAAYLATTLALGRNELSEFVSMFRPTPPRTAGHRPNGSRPELVRR